MTFKIGTRVRGYPHNSPQYIHEGLVQLADINTRPGELLIQEDNGQDYYIGEDTAEVVAPTQEKTAFAGGGVRDSDAGKERFDLCRPKNVPYEDQMLTRFARLMAEGARKYAERNWEQFCDQAALDRAYGSLDRHHAKYRAGLTDEDHAASIFANVMFIEYVKGVLRGDWPALEADE